MHKEPRRNRVLKKIDKSFSAQMRGFESLSGTSTKEEPTLYPPSYKYLTEGPFEFAAFVKCVQGRLEGLDHFEC